MTQHAEIPATDELSDGPGGARAATATLNDEQREELVQEILEDLKDVVDPELGINVVDLGLIYGVDVASREFATLDMTLTSAACPLTDVIEEQAHEALKDT